MSHAALAPAIYGLLAEFDTPTDLVHAAEAAYAAGYRKIDAYSPFPIEEASEAIGFHKSRVPLIVLLGGILGGASGFGLQYWINCHLLSAEYRRQALSIVAGVYCSDVSR